MYYAGNDCELSRPTFAFTGPRVNVISTRISPWVNVDVQAGPFENIQHLTLELQFYNRPTKRPGTDVLVCDIDTRHSYLIYIMQAL